MSAATIIDLTNAGTTLPLYTTATAPILEE